MLALALVSGQAKRPNLWFGGRSLSRFVMLANLILAPPSLRFGEQSHGMVPAARGVMTDFVPLP